MFYVKYIKGIYIFLFIGFFIIILFFSEGSGIIIVWLDVFWLNFFVLIFLILDIFKDLGVRCFLLVVILFLGFFMLLILVWWVFDVIFCDLVFFLSLCLLFRVLGLIIFCVLVLYFFICLVFVECMIIRWKNERIVEVNI